MLNLINVAEKGRESDTDGLDSLNPGEDLVEDGDTRGAGRDKAPQLGQVHNQSNLFTDNLKHISKTLSYLP